MEVACSTQEQVLAELARVAGDAPFLALGQTIFWDEPMKGGVVQRAAELGFPRRLVAGVHDTDYFAKLSGAKDRHGYAALPHNDTTTKDLWSAAAEFSTLFGSETVVTRDILQKSGVNLKRIERHRPHALDELTEAWGWRGLASFDHRQTITAETPLREMFGTLFETLEWAVKSTLEAIQGQNRVEADKNATHLLDIACDASDQATSLAAYYRHILPDLYRMIAGAEVEATVTTELLRFNSRTAHLPRFELVDFFLREPRARHAYNETVHGTEVYELDRFGTGALPFEVVVPGHGRGTLRLGNRGLVITTPKPLFASLKKPIRSIGELAEVLERKFGPNCVLLGKALTLIGMLSREFVFVFHSGASMYVKQSRRLHDGLRELGWTEPFNPILRVSYSPWDALGASCSWLKLPGPLARAFCTDELCSPSFSGRWREVSRQQQAVLDELSALRGPIELIRYLANQIPGAWETLQNDHERAHGRMEKLNGELNAIRAQKREVAQRQYQLRKQRNELEHEKGRHWRAFLFDNEPTPDAILERQKLVAQIDATVAEITEVKRQWHALQLQQDMLVASPDVLEAQRTYRNIELEAELKRASLIRDAVIVTRGLKRAGLRPAAWWFPLVCPDGTWFRQTMKDAEYSLEAL